jgi:hypothetical protein
MVWARRRDLEHELIPETANDSDEALVRSLAEAFGAAIRPEHLGEVAAAWRLMRPHLERVQAVQLACSDEPASLFRP